ncbi:MAG: nucleoside permease nupX [Nitrospinae bacterium CG11_big_fil_rev_8_21_14_0_20_56_8]|nr:MAG: nucleoside permease nupX [Nitrospinae bacterium CG11_big_fil_rev_8_21_14_0_20_56_8]
MNSDVASLRIISAAGFGVLCALAWATGNRSAVNLRTVGGSVALAWVLGILTFQFSWSRSALSAVNDLLVTVLQASQKGTLFLLGPLALGPGQTLPDGTPSVGFILAMQVLPSVIFFSALVSGLYYLGIMQAVVRVFARIFHRTMSLSGAEALAAAANVFVGIESGLTVRPYLPTLTRSELLTLLTCMMATVASTVMGIYVIALKSVFPQIAGHLVSASLISIPCAVLVSKLSLPETGRPETLGELPPAHGSFNVGGEKPSNLMVALIEGGGQGLRMAAGIATVLIVILGLEAILDLVLGQLPGPGGAPLTLGRILGWATWPVGVLMGLRPEEWASGAAILGSRFIETEVTAYFTLAAVQSASPPPFDLRSITIMTYSLCGFVHLASMGIFVGGLAALIPERMRDLTVLGFRGLWTAFLATALTGCIAGALA